MDRDVSMCVRACVRACVCMRGRERERERGIERCWSAEDGGERRWGSSYHCAQPDNRFTGIQNARECMRVITRKLGGQEVSAEDV